MVRVRPVLQAGQAYPSRRTRVPPVRSFDRLKSIWPMKSEIIFYARVSTRRQGRSGLGLSAQRKAVQAFADTEAFQIVSEYVEVETGKGADALDRRPQLKAALVEAKRRKCSVVVAKLDRLSRDVEFISGLMSRRVPHRRRAGAGRRSVHAAHLCRAGRAGASHDLTANQGGVG